MNEDQLKQLFADNPVPAPDAQAKKRISAEAMAAFEAQASDSDAAEKNNSEIPQGNSNDDRPTHEMNAQVVRMKTMKKNVFWLSSLAATMVLGIGFFGLRDVLIPETYDQPYQGPTQPITLETPVTTSPQRAVVDRLAQDDEIEADMNAGGRQKEIAEAELAMGEARSAEEQAPAPKADVQLYDSSKTEEFAVSQATSMTSSPKPGVLKQARRLEKKVMSQEARISAYAPAVSEGLSLSEPIASVPTEDRDRFKSFEESPVKLVSEQPVSTFSIDVDTAAYSYVRRQLNRGVMPQKDAVRLEELINYFDYQYPLPLSKDRPFETSVNVVDSPWNKGNKLVHIGIKGYDVVPESQPDSNLVFLLDVSGSMGSADKLPLVKQSMELLLSSLKPTDTIAIVVYAGAAGTVLEPTPVKEKAKILAAMNRLNAGGSTAGGQGIALAYQLAELHYKKNAVNRIVLATDGDFNVGVTRDERLEDFVARKREKGIYLSVLGFGQGNYADAMMQSLAQNGNGVAAYIDTLGEAQKVLVEEANAALFPIANDVKIQVEFNPSLVSEYRLIGYETRALKREDFNNDKVDAGDIGAGHTVTAIYEVTPVGSSKKLHDDLRYAAKPQQEQRRVVEYGFLKLRYKLPGETKSKLISSPIVAQDSDKSLMNSEMNFSIAVAAFGQLLKGGKYLGDWDYDKVIDLAQKNKGADPFGYRTEFIQLVRRAKVARGM